MIEDSKCDCQRCGNPIAFPIDMHNEEVECPHCHKATTLIVSRPEQRIRAINSPLDKSADPKNTTNKSEQGDLEGLIMAGYVTALLLPIVGFIIGVILLSKNRTGSGLGCIIMSIACGFIALAIFSN